MLENLVESKNTRNKSRSGYLVTTFILVVGLAFSGVLWSLFAKNLNMGAGDFALETLISPVPMPDNAPPPAPQTPKQSAPTVNNQTTRQTNMLRVEESPLVPKVISTTPNTLKARPNAPFIISNRPEVNFQSQRGADNERGNGGGGGSIGGENSGSEMSKSAVAPVPPPAPIIKKEIAAVDTKPVSTIKSGGVVNGKATSLPKPPYPAAARALNVEGEVNVQVLIDEAGNVVSARAVSGHPLLRSVSEIAARGAKFSPTSLSGQPVKVSGIIVYKFSK